MKFDTTILGTRVKFLNPPGMMPNITFLAEINPEEDTAETNFRSMTKWSDPFTKLVFEMHYNVIIIDVKTWVTGYLPVDEEKQHSLTEPKLVTVNYRTISTHEYASMLLSNVIAKFPLDSDLVHDGSNGIKYLCTLDFVQHRNKKSPFIINGFIDVVVSMVYLPKIDEDLFHVICESVISKILDRIEEGNIIPEVYEPTTEVHIVGYDPGTCCVEFVVMLNGICKSEDGDYYAIEEIGKEYFTIDERLIEDDPTLREYDGQFLLKALSNTALMDEKGFNVVNNLGSATNSMISLLRESGDIGKRLVTFIPSFDRYEIHPFDYDHKLNYDKIPEYNNGSIHYFQYVGSWQSDWCTEYRPVRYIDGHPLLIVKVPKDNFGNKSLPRPPKVLSDCKLFAANSQYLWFAWYKL